MAARFPAIGRTEADFKTEIAPYLAGRSSPSAPWPARTTRSRSSAIATGFAGEAGNDQDESWHYCSADGQFIVNSSELTNNENDDAALKYDQL